MKEVQQRQIETLRVIVLFFKEHRFTNARVLHLVKELLGQYERILQLVAENRNAKFEPKVGRHVTVSTKDELREEQMLPLSRRGRKIAREHPQLRKALKVPHKNAPLDQIVEAAERIADALKPHRNVLIEAAFPRNCLTTLRRDARALLARADAVQKSRTLLGRSNRELTKELSLARETINELDLALRTLDNYESFAFAWNYANRIRARKGRPSKRRLAARERSAARRRAREDGSTGEASI